MIGLSVFKGRATKCDRVVCFQLECETCEFAGTFTFFWMSEGPIHTKTCVLPIKIDVCKKTCVLPVKLDFDTLETFSAEGPAKLAAGHMCVFCSFLSSRSF